MGRLRLGLIVRCRRNAKYFTRAILLLTMLAKTRTLFTRKKEARLPEESCRMETTTDPIFMFCNWPYDWSCRSELFQVLAKQFSTRESTFIFSIDCMVFDVHPRIFFVGGITDVEQAQKHPFYDNSDIRVLLNFEPSAIPESIMVGSTSKFDVAFTSQIQSGSGQEIPALFTWPYVSFSMSQSSSLDLSQLEARVSPSVLPQLFGAYATSHCRAAHRTKFYNMVAGHLEPLFHLNKRCGEHDRYPTDLGVMSDRDDELNFMGHVISRYAQFKFVVVFENKLIDAYITEKLLLARLSGAIPVYFGGKLARMLFNPSAFIDCSPDSMGNLNSALESCIRELRSVNENASKWRAMYEAPFLNIYDHRIAMQLVSDILLMYIESAGNNGSVGIRRNTNLTELCSKLQSQLWLHVPFRLSERCASS